MNRRRGLLPQLCAICLLLLAMSPLTAPFSTLDLATLSGPVSPCDSSKLTTKPSTEPAPLAAAVHATNVVPERTAATPAVAPDLPDRLQAAHVVLRI